MKITIEKINGVEHTVVWYNDNTVPDWANFKVVRDDLGISTGEYKCPLPPLPKHPTKDDARLLHLYAAHGLELQGYETADDSEPLYNTRDILYNFDEVTITHCITESGERVEVVIINKEGL
jgi:hypothetical protein